MKTKHNLAGIAYGAAAALCAASYLTINRHVYLTYKPSAFNYTATFLIGAGLCGLISLLANLKQTKKLSAGHYGQLVFNGVMAGIGLGLVAYGQRYTTAVNASIIFTSTIIPTTIFSLLMFKDRLSRKQLGWMAILFIGLYLAVVGAHWLNINKGDLIVLAGAVFIGFTNAYAKNLLRFTSSQVVADSRLASGALFFVVIGLAFSGSKFLVTSVGLWPLLAGFFLWTTLRAFYLTVKAIGPNQAVVLVNSHPVITPILGVLLLSEPYGWVKAAGSAIMLLSVYQITKK